MHQTIQSASGREIHPSINPALAGFDRALRRTRPDTAGADAGADKRNLFLARARAVVARTRLLWN